jgi:hypothetical protein
MKRGFLQIGPGLMQRCWSIRPAAKPAAIYDMAVVNDPQIRKCHRLANREAKPQAVASLPHISGTADVGRD